MKIRTKFILFVVLIHLASLVLSFFVFKDQKWIFLVSEVVIIISVIICWQIYEELITPLKLLVQGAEAITDRDFNVRFVETGSPEMDKLISVYNRMMDELRLERTKQEEQHFFLEKLIHTSPTGIIILDYDGNIEQVNPKAFEFPGMSDLDAGKRANGVPDHPLIRKINDIASGTSATITIDGAATYKIHKSHFLDRGFPRYFVTIEVLTGEILEAEKNAYGKVIRMMAHEVNNTIGPVNSIMESALNKFRRTGEDTPVEAALQVAVDRNNNLNAFMRNFADLVRLPVPVKQQIDLVPVVRAMSRLMEARVGGRQIIFEDNIGEQTFMIAADQQLLEQVLINVIKNAMEAIEVTGTINFTLDRQHRKLIISDSGKGIDNALSENLFKPFFSTKKDGQGIGLTLIREVLFNHGFRFSLKTHLKGTDHVSSQTSRTDFTIIFN